MINVLEFDGQFESLLSVTHALLMSSNLTVHPSVARIILHGSRGLADRYRPDSDVDLSLIVELAPGMARSDVEVLLRDVLETTKSHWQGEVEVDLAVVFDIRNCGLNCFEHTLWTDQICKRGGVDCFGLYKIGKGFNGLVVNAGVQVKLMYPCIKIWQRK